MLELSGNLSILEGLFNVMHQGVVVHAKDGHITQWNDAALAILGLSADQLQGRTSIDPSWHAIHEDGSPFPGETHPAMLTLADTKPRREIIMGVFSPGQNHHRWISVDSFPLFDKEGTELIGVYAVFTDITRMKELEKSIEEERQRFELAVSGTEDGLWDWNVVKDTTYFSPRWKGMLGYTDEEIPNTYEAFEALIHPEDVARVQQALENHFHHAIPYEPELRMRTKSGDYRWIQSRGKAVFDEAGRPVRMLGFHTDIHDKKMLEANYHRELKFNETIIDQAGSIVAVLDKEGTIVRINHTIEQMTGFAESEVVGQHVFDIFIPEENRERVEQVFASLKAGNFPNKNKNEWLRKDGSRIPLAWGNSCITDKEGNVTHVIAVGVDISEEERLRKELEEYKQVLEQRVEEEVQKRMKKEAELDIQENLLIQQSKMAEMGEMIGAIAHQLKQPINTISLLAQMLPEEIELGNMDYVEESLHDIVNGTEFMSDTITEFRNFFRQDNTNERFSVSAAVTSVGKILEYDLKTHSIGFSASVDPELTLVGHPNKFKQVILNLVNNAKDAIKEHHQHNSLITVSAEASAQSIIIHIDDNGGGIPPEILKRIFEPYFTTKGGAAGTGIGLQIVRTIVEKHFNGEISVVSENGTTRFTLRFPRQ